MLHALRALAAVVALSMAVSAAAAIAGDLEAGSWAAVVALASSGAFLLLLYHRAQLPIERQLPRPRLSASDRFRRERDRGRRP